MCIGIPLQIAAADGLTGQTANGQVIDLALTGPVEPGTWVLTHLGAARDIISREDARLISAALEGLARVMEGGTPGAAFADLETESPRLPPHLQAALAAGKTTA